LDMVLAPGREYLILAVATLEAARESVTCFGSVAEFVGDF